MKFLSIVIYFFAVTNIVYADHDRGDDQRTPALGSCQSASNSCKSSQRDALIANNRIIDDLVRDLAQIRTEREKDQSEFNESNSASMAEATLNLVLKKEITFIQSVHETNPSHYSQDQSLFYWALSTNQDELLLYPWLNIPSSKISWNITNQSSYEQNLAYQIAQSDNDLKQKNECSARGYTELNRVQKIEADLNNKMDSYTRANAEHQYNIDYYCEKLSCG